MKEALHTILEIQELDMKMLRLVRVRRERQKELAQIHLLRKEVHEQIQEKEKEIVSLGQEIQALEQKISDVQGKIKKLEGQQSSIKKVDEFNALTQETTQAERERIALEQKVSDLVDKRNSEEEILTKLKDTLKSSEQSSAALEKEIRSSIQMINDEGITLKKERDQLAKKANVPVLKIYERLLQNKKDRVVVPIENRTCSGCHIVLTAQHENLVRKGEKLPFCEYCSRIHYWQETSSPEEGETAPKRRRRRTAAT